MYLAGTPEPATTTHDPATTTHDPATTTHDPASPRVISPASRAPARVPARLPDPLPHPAQAPLGITGAARLRLAGAGAARAFARPDVGPRIRTYVSDMIQPYGLELRGDLVEAGVGHAYSELGAALIEAAVPDGAPVDLLVLAYAVPDILPGRATATYLSEVCPGGPLAFAVSGQGTAAGFTGLRLAAEYARSGGCRRALVLVVEQPTLHYRPAGPARLPEAATGVALRCEPGTAEVTVHQHTDVAPEHVPGLLSALDPSYTLIREPGLAGWWELAGALADGGAGVGGGLTLAGYDPELRYLCLASLAGDHHG